MNLLLTLKENNVSSLKIGGAFAFELGHSFLYPEEDSSKDERNLAFEGNSNLGVDGSTSFEGGVFSVNHLYKTHRGYSSSDLSIPAVAPKYYKELTFQEDDASDSSPLKAVPDFINMAAHQASPDLENENLRARISNGHLWNDVLTDISNVLYDVNWRADLLDGESSPFNFYGVFSLSKSDKVWGDQSPAFVLPPKNESSCGKDGAHHHHYPHSVGCNMANMTVVFKGHPKELFVQVNSSTLLDISNLLPKCKYDINGKHGSFHFTTPYNGCYVKKLGDCFVLNLVWKNKPVVLSCPAEPTPILLTFCQRDKMTIVLPEGPLDLLKVKDRFNKWITAYKIAHKCKYLVWRDSLGRIVFSASFKACHVMEMGKQHVLTVKYIMSGMNKSVNVRCEQSMKPRIHCRVSNMTIELPHGPLEKVFIKSQLNKLIAVKDAPKYCRYHLVRDRGMNLLTASYLSCDVKTVNYNYVLPVFYTSASGKQGSVNMECPATTGKPRVICRRSSMTVYLPKVPIEQIRLRNHHGKTVPIHAAKHCHYILMEGNRRLIFTTSYKACDVQIKHRHYILTVVYTSDTKGEASVEMKCPVEETETIPSQSVTCGKSGMTMLLPKGSPEDVKIIDYLGNEVAVRNVSKPCQYMLEKHWNGSVSFTAHYRSCDVKLQGGYYMLTVLYKPLSGPKLVGHMRCPASDQSSHTPHDFPVVICESTSMMVELPVASDVKVLDADKEHHILGIAKECGYKLREKENTLLFTTTYDGCHVRILDGHYSLTVVYRSIGEEKFWLQMKCPVQAYPGQSTPPAIVPTKPIPYVTCKNASMTVMLPDSNLDGITVKDAFGQEVQVDSVPSYCGYQLVRSHGKINFTSLYGACDVSIEHGKYVLTVGYKLTHGPKKYITLRCPVLVVPADSSSVICKYDGMNAVLPDGKLNKVKIINMFNEELIVNQAPVECGYSLVKVHGKITLTVRYTSCDVTVKHNMYWLTVLYTPAKGTELSLTMSCPVVAPSVPTTTTVMTPSSQPTVICGSSSMRVILPNGSPDWVRIINLLGEAVPVSAVSPECGYVLRKVKGKIIFTVPYDSCEVSVEDGFYVLTMYYTTENGQQMKVHMKCPTSSGDAGLSTTIPPTNVVKSTPSAPPVTCNFFAMSVMLPEGSPTDVLILDNRNEAVPVNQLPSRCGYVLRRKPGGLLLTAQYTSCDVRIKNQFYMLSVLYTPSGGVETSVTMQCPVIQPPTTMSTTTTMPGTPSIPLVICQEFTMEAILPAGLLSQVKITDSFNQSMAVNQAPNECGYTLRKAGGKIVFSTPYDACDVYIKRNHYVLNVLYSPDGGMEMSVTMRCPIKVPTTTKMPSSTSTLSTKGFTPIVICRSSSMMVTLPDGSPQSVGVLDALGEQVAVTQQPSSCGYTLIKTRGNLQFTALYKACDVQIIGGSYVLDIMYQPSSGPEIAVQMECPTTFGDGLTTITTMPSRTTIFTVSIKPTVICSSTSMTAMLPDGSLDDVQIIACTADGHFVFAVYRTASKPEVDPATLVVSGNQSCLPVICTPEFAIFKFPVTGCGTYVFVIAETTIYVAEVQGLIRRKLQTYGLITRDSPFRCPRNESAVNLILKDLAGYPLPKYIRRFNLQTFQFLDPRTWKHLDEEVYFMCSTEICPAAPHACNEGCFDGRIMPSPASDALDKRCSGSLCPKSAHIAKRAIEGAVAMSEKLNPENFHLYGNPFYKLTLLFLGLLCLAAAAAALLIIRNAMQDVH
ncbi:ZP4 protein, partial [Polypterus senegalus]|nr:ZP4 protein [Polypterus senegalus]